MTFWSYLKNNKFKIIQNPNSFLWRIGLKGGALSPLVLAKNKKSAVFHLVFVPVG